MYEILISTVVLDKCVVYECLKDVTPYLIKIKINKTNKEVFVKHEQAPTAPKLEGVWVFVDLNIFSMKTDIFGRFDHFRSGVFWPKWSKGTSTEQDLSFEPITKSLCPSVQKFYPVQAQILENRYIGLFWLIWPLPVGCFWPKWSKGTSTDQTLSFEPITKSLWPSV